MRTELKKFRIGLHLKQDEMADKCGVSRVTYGKIENGKRFGSYSFWDKLQSIFEVPNDELRKLQKVDESE